MPVYQLIGYTCVYYSVEASPPGRARRSRPFRRLRPRWLSAADALTIYGTFSFDLEAETRYEDSVAVIEDGNHAQFGNYGRQFGDPDATISADEQQDEAVDAIAAFVAARE